MPMIRDRRWDDAEKPASLWQSLTEGWKEVRAALGGIPTQTVRTVDFVGPIASLTFAVSRISRPVGVQLVSLYDVATGETSAVTFSWTYANGSVTTTAFAALAAGTWRATFIVIGGA